MNFHIIKNKIKFRKIKKKKFNYSLKVLKFIFFLFLLILYIFFKLTKNLKDVFSYLKFFNSSKQINLNYENFNFAIIRRIGCASCGLFSDYIVYLGCINKFLQDGFVPIIDLQYYKNIFNGYNINSLNENPWEIFFHQPFNFTLNNVIKNGKNIKIFKCPSNYFRPDFYIFNNKVLNDFWHNVENIYIPLRKEIIHEKNIIKSKLFKGSKNLLGILVRGTDYVALKPGGHPIPPNKELVIKDIIEFDKKNNYDFFFISTEDDMLREIFIKQFGHKLNKFTKIYLLNMIMLAECIDIICARTSGTIGVFIFKNGFRYKKVYNIGYYK